MGNEWLAFGLHTENTLVTVHSTFPSSPFSQQQTQQASEAIIQKYHFQSPPLPAVSLHLLTSFKSTVKCTDVTASPFVFAAITCSHKVEACVCFCLPALHRWTASSE